MSIQTIPAMFEDFFVRKLRAAGPEVAPGSYLPI